MEEFNNEFITEEDNGALDDMTLEIGKLIFKDESRASVINPHRISEMEKAYRLIKESVNKKGVKISYKLHSPFQSMGSISIIGKNFTFDNTEKFVQACSYASNVDTFPKTDGSIEMDLTFHGLTKPIE